MSEMVERVALALRAAFMNAPCSPFLGASDGKPDYVEEMMARAAIGAMREPTEAMIGAGHGPMPLQTRSWVETSRDGVLIHRRTEVIYPGDPLYVPPGPVYQAMIDEALK